MTNYMTKGKIIQVKDTAVTVIKINDNDYISLTDMLKTDEKTIFENSKYKPKKQ